MKSFKQFDEGTWASPDTLKKRQQLKVLLRKPIKGKDATDVEYTGWDDELKEPIWLCGITIID